jgi:hypothetical protein
MDLETILNGLDVAITITDEQGNFIFVNSKSGEINAHSNAQSLIGKQVRQCHNDRSIAIIEQLFKGEKNVYTITKKGQEKLIYQAPWTVDGVVKGLVELSMVIPKNMPHYDRDKINPSTSDQ